MKIKNITFYFFMILVLAAALLVAGCNLGIYSGSADVKLNLGDARALTSSISSVTLTISGPDMETITKEYDSTDLESPDWDWIIDIQLDPGTNRLFEVSATLSPDPTKNPTAILEYYGKAKQDIAGDTTTVDIHMGISRVRIVTANPNESGGLASIVSTDDLGPNWANWTRIQKSNVSGWSDSVPFQPWDIDIDENGFLIIGNNTAFFEFQGGAILWRMSSLSSPVYEPIISLTGIGIVAVSVDRNKKLIYFADTFDKIYSCDYLGQNQKTYDGVSLTGITGLTVDDSGYLYVTHGTDVTKVDPAGNAGTGSVSAEKTITGATLEDVMFKSIDGTGYIYVTDSANKQIVKLKASDLSIVASFTNASFYGPRRFVATLNSGIYFTDEDTNQNYDQLVYMDDISGKNLDIKGTHGFNKGEFSFQY